MYGSGPKSAREVICSSVYLLFFTVMLLPPGSHKTGKLTFWLEEKYGRTSRAASVAAGVGVRIQLAATSEFSYLHRQIERSRERCSLRPHGSDALNEQLVLQRTCGCEIDLRLKTGRCPAMTRVHAYPQDTDWTLIRNDAAESLRKLALPRGLEPLFSP